MQREKLASSEFIVLDNILYLQVMEPKSGMLMQKKQMRCEGIYCQETDGSWAAANMRSGN